MDNELAWLSENRRVTENIIKWIENDKVIIWCRKVAQDKEIQTRNVR